MSGKLRVNSTRMKDVSSDTSPFQAFGKRASEENVGKFAGAIGDPLRVRVLGIEIVKVYFPHRVAHGRDIDYPSWGSFLDAIKKEVGEEKVTKVVGAKLHLKAVLR